MTLNLFCVFCSLERLNSQAFQKMAILFVIQVYLHLFTCFFQLCFSFLFFFSFPFLPPPLPLFLFLSFSSYVIWNCFLWIFSLNKCFLSCVLEFWWHLLTPINLVVRICLSLDIPPSPQKVPLLPVA